MSSDATVIEFRKARGAGDVLNATFHYIRQNAWLLGKSLLYIVGPVMAVVLIVQTYFQAQTFWMWGFGGPDPTATEEELLSQLGTFFGATMLMAVVGVVATTLAVLVVYGHMMLYQDRGPGGFGVADVWQITKANFVRILATGVALFLIVMLPVVIMIVPCLGALAYLAWAVYAGVTFSLAFPLRMQEGVGLFEAFGRCRELVKGAFWQTFAVIFLVGILYYVLSVAVSLPAMILVFTAGFSSASAEPGALTQAALFVLSVVSTIGSTVLYCVPLVAIAFQYFSLVEEQEHVGLRERVARVSGEAEADAKTTAANPFAPQLTARPEETAATEGTGASSEADREEDVRPGRNPTAPPRSQAESGATEEDGEADEPSDDERRWGPRRAE